MAALMRESLLRSFTDVQLPSRCPAFGRWPASL